jgi:hypothetical protein
VNAADSIHVTYSELPQIRCAAPELCDDLLAHQSWTAPLVVFLRDRRITPSSRVARPLH